MNARLRNVDQVLTGIRSVLSNPVVYDSVQSLLGVNKARKYICENNIAAANGDVVIDVGCGTSELLKYLPGCIRYFGFDLSEQYIKAARRRYANRGNCQFYCADLASVKLDDLPPCQHAIAYGVLHHLSDAVANRVLTELYARLGVGGRVVTVDPVLVDGQSAVARGLIARDRGQHVRSADGYLALVPDDYTAKSISVRHDLLRVPYSLAIMTCERDKS